jgi:integrase
MHDITTPAAETTTPLRRHNLSKYFARPSGAAVVAQSPQIARLPNASAPKTAPPTRPAVLNPPQLAEPKLASRHLASGNAETFAKLRFREAAELWLDSQKQTLRKRTAVGYDYHIRALNVSFGNLRLEDIYIGHVIAHQEARSQNEGGRWTKPAKASCINHEIVVLMQVMKRAQLWRTRIGDEYRPLELPAFEGPKVLNDLEKHRLFHVASQNPDWQLAYCVITITANTGASGCELRNLRFDDVILDRGEPRFVISSATAKNRARGRVAVMNPTAKEAMEKCMERGRKLGSGRPDHYIFPFRTSPKHYDPRRPTTDAWLRHSFKDMTIAAGVPWLTPHCLRHQFVTEMCEKGVAPETIRGLVGHVSDEMMRHYCHPRLESQMAAVRLLDHSPKTLKKKAVQARTQLRLAIRGRRRLAFRRATT